MSQKSGQLLRSWTLHEEFGNVKIKHDFTIEIFDDVDITFAPFRKLKVYFWKIESNDFILSESGKYQLSMYTF